MPPNIPQISAPQLSVPNVSGILPQQPNAFMQLLQAAGQFPQQQQESQMRKAQLDQTNQQTQLNKQTMQSNEQKIAQEKQAYEQNERVNAQQGFSFLKNVAQTNPQSIHTPQFQARLQQIDKTLGMSSFNPDGTVNPDAFKTPFNQLPPDQQAAFWAMPADQRTTAGQQYSGLPPDWQTRKQELDPKTSAQVGELQSLANLHEIEGRKAITSSINDTRRTSATVTKDMSEARLGAINSSARIAEANAAVSRANSYAAQSQATIQHLNAMSAEVYQKMMSGRANPQEQKFFLQQAGVYSKQIDKANSELSKSLTELQQAAKVKGIPTTDDTGGDWVTTLLHQTPDPVANQKLLGFAGAAASAKQSIQQATSQYNTTVDFVRSANPGLASYLKNVGGTGATPTLTPQGADTSPKPKQPTDEAWVRAVTRGYKPTFKDGKWGLVNPSDNQIHYPPTKQ